MTNFYNTIVHRIHVDPITYQEKPEGDEVGSINNRLLSNFEDYTVEEIVNLATQGHSLCLGHFRGERSWKTWLYQSMLMLDFDNKDKKTKQRVDNPISFLQVEQRLKDFGLDCNFAYTTFSHSDNWHRFRVGLQLHKCIFHLETYYEIAAALLLLFPEIDPMIKNPVGLYFGGKEIIYKNYNYFLDIPVLKDAAHFYAVRNSSSKNMSRDIARTEGKMGLHKNGSKKNTAYINNIGTAVFASKNRVENKIEIVRGVNFDELRKEIKILNDFMNPEVKLYHPQLLGLATNLRYLEGGQNLYEQCITANPDYAQEEKLKIMTYCKSCNYFPMSLESFSLYEDDWEYGTLLNAARKKEIIRLNRKETMSVEQSRQELNNRFMNILRSDDQCIDVVKGVTGIGKTELYKNLEDILIAFPYHFLKDEIATDRMTVPCRQTPSLDKLPGEVRDSLEYYYSIGAFSWANQYLSDMSEIYASVKQYQDDCFACYASGNTVLTTHQKAIFIPFWAHRTIIFDEDLIPALMPIDKVAISDLLRLEANLSNSNDKRIISSLINDIREGRFNTPREMDVSVFENFRAIEDEVLGNNTYESNILNFFDAQYFVVDAQDVTTIYYINKYGLPPDKKIIVLSATADETMYKHLFGDRLRFHDMSNVEPVGLIEQDTKYSFSQSRFLTHSKYAKEKVGNLPVITFDKFKAIFPNPVSEMHFGYCSGSDKYNGQDIAVVGTPHVSPVTIALYAKALGVPVKTHDFARIRQQPVYRNGFRFWFYTYDNEDLRSIQFYFIETGLKQAIGRSRPHTMPSTVKVLSNYPLPESSIGAEEQRIGRKRLEYNARMYLEECLIVSKNSKGIRSSV